MLEREGAEILDGGNLSIYRTLTGELAEDENTSLEINVKLNRRYEKTNFKNFIFRKKEFCERFLNQMEEKMRGNFFRRWYVLC